jgi:hypothetical protein
LPDNSPLKIEKYKFETDIEFYSFNYEKLDKVTLQVSTSDEVVGKITLENLQRNYSITGLKFQKLKKDWYELETPKEAWKGSYLKVRIVSE